MKISKNPLLYPGRDLNPHGHYCPRDFKSRVSTNSTTKACCKKSRTFIGIRAENETRTRDPNLGKVMLYQLSYFRRCVSILTVQRYNKNKYLK